MEDTYVINESVSNFIKRTKIKGTSTNTITAAAYQQENVHMYPVHKITATFSNLDSLHIFLNTSCPLPSSLAEELRVDTCLYLLKVYNTETLKATGICKIGITSNINRRLKELNTAWNSAGLVFKPHKLSDKKMTSADALEVEQAIHKVLAVNELEYSTIHKIQGYTELFNYQEWMDNLIP